MSVHPSENGVNGVASSATHVPANRRSQPRTPPAYDSRIHGRSSELEDEDGDDVIEEATDNSVWLDDEIEDDGPGWDIPQLECDIDDDLSSYSQDEVGPAENERVDYEDLEDEEDDGEDEHGDESRQAAAVQSLSPIRGGNKHHNDDDGNDDDGEVVARIACDSDYAQSTFCQDHLIPFLTWLLRRHAKLGGVTEIRAIAEQPTKFIRSGYFDAEHCNELVEQILPMPYGPRDKIPYGGTPRIGEANFYFTMQPANAALLARSAHKFGRCQATSDGDIVGYHLFAVDVDPVRPSGISATDLEKCEAAKVAIAIVRYFRERGIGFIPADSGNGYHLLVPTIPYKDVAAAAADAQALLHLLNDKFSTSTAKVDTTIYNPGRILKLYGTMAMKGSDMPDRPHRFARVGLESIPDDIDLFGVMRKEIDDFRKASDATAKPTPTPAPAKNPSSKSVSRNGWDAETSKKVMRAVLERSELPFRSKIKGDDTFYEFRDCPYHDDPDGHTYECCVIVRRDGSFAAKCMHDDQATWREHFKSAVGWDEHIGPVLDALGIARRPVPYRATRSGIVYVKPSNQGSIEVPLTNFTAVIVSDIAEDDGAESRHVFEIEAQLGGRTSRFAIAAEKFVGMTWPVEQLGAQAVVHAGQGNKDHARAAIQLLSGEIPTETVYTHLGWRRHEGQWVYLHAGGAIGPNGPVDSVRVHLAETFTRFDLPLSTTDEELVRAVHASVRFLNIAPDMITVPLFAGIWRSVIGGTDFSQFLVGPTGDFKTEVAALVQQFWGAGLDSHHTPASWKNTANTNEALAFTCKDAVLLVDDFSPTGSTYDVQRAHREADQLLRGQGNRTGRGRMRADASLRPVKPPRGMIVGTGEDVPRGQSLQARILVHEIAEGTVNQRRLTKRQRDAAAGLFATTLSGFVRWLAPRYDQVIGEYIRVLPLVRHEANTTVQHRRTPNIIANLYLGLELFTEFAEECGAFVDGQGDELMDRGWKALGQAASAQSALQKGSEPAQRFMELLDAAVASGKAHIADASGAQPSHPERWGWRRGANWEPRGDRVGWLDDSSVYLEPEAAFAAVQRLAQDGGEPLTISNKTLHKRLHEKNLLVSTDTARRRLVLRKTLEGRLRPVLHLSASIFGMGGLAE